MILADSEILRRVGLGLIEIEPFDPRNVQPSSVDLTLGSEFVQFRMHSDLMTPIDPFVPMEESDVVRFEADEFALAPGQFALATTVERIQIHRTLVGRLDGKSSLARLGLVVHATAGFVDPGWNGQLTLEIFNFAPRPILLRPGMRIAQISFTEMVGQVQMPYGSMPLGSKYQDQQGATISMYHLNRPVDNI